jgi:membrane protein
MYAQLRGMLGAHGALAVQDLLESARRPAGNVPAAAFGLAVLIVAGKFVIGLYIGRSGITSAFGAAASLIVVLLWVYYSAQVFRFGAEFTWVWSHRYGSRRALARSS